ncbi:pectinesterase-like [Cornus florida]|uniref:pectinesterase-like n=1 Tax=Cornus florida TaxID=4283 RepID=UPI0028A1C8EB|nr:pectinesterase-like [Cornus florida]
MKAKKDRRKKKVTPTFLLQRPTKKAELETKELVPVGVASEYKSRKVSGVRDWPPYFFILSDQTTIVVSKDGSGDYSTISKAVSAIPDSSSATYTIYIKKGTYSEAVDVGREKKSVVFMGDGIDQTIIQFNKSNSTGYGTNVSATVNIEAQKFVAKNISFVNTAGANAGQAVALRSIASNDAYYKCSFEGYQDTLYVHSGTKLFYECNIYGTVDFIFGDATSMFQNCNIYGRNPGKEGMPIVVTADRRDAANSDTGIVIQNCTITAAPNFGPSNSNFRAFLGRPWREYSRVVVMESFLGNIVNPAGWAPWDKNSRLDHLSYIEYDNRGPGAATSRRVKWPGFQIVTRSSQMLQFTAKNFIHANDWLPSTGVPFIPGLTGDRK